MQALKRRTLPPASSPVAQKPPWDPFADDVAYRIGEALYDDLVEVVHRQGYPTGMTIVEDFETADIDRDGGVASFSASFHAEHPVAGDIRGTISGRFEFSLDEARDLLEEGELDEEEAIEAFLETVELADARPRFQLE
jgi:hypothetical protein